MSFRNATWLKPLMVGLVVSGIVLPLFGDPAAVAESETNFLVAAMRVQPERWDKAHNLGLLKSTHLRPQRVGHVSS